MEPRIGDAEREVATARLGDHFAAGRLEHEEYDERLDAIWSARTRSDLDQLFWDLPAAVAPMAPTTPARRGASGSWRLPIAMLLVGAALLAIALEVPWWGWLIAIVIVMKRPWAHGRNPHGRPGYRGRGHRSCA